MIPVVACCAAVFAATPGAACIPESCHYDSVNGAFVDASGPDGRGLHNASSRQLGWNTKLPGWHLRIARWQALDEAFQLFRHAPCSPPKSQSLSEWDNISSQTAIVEVMTASV